MPRYVILIRSFTAVTIYIVNSSIMIITVAVIWIPPLENIITVNFYMVQKPLPELFIYKYRENSIYLQVVDADYRWISETWPTPFFTKNSIDYEN